MVHSSKTIDKKSGFTLVETLVSLSVFMVVLVIAVGSLVSVIDANRKARSQKLVSDNLSSSLETMSRTIREGSNLVITNNGHTLTLMGIDGSQVVYMQAGNQINRSINGAAPVALTAPDVTITDLTFALVSFGGGANEQPKIRITLEGTAGTGKTKSDFSIQTLVSQRFRSIGLPSTGGGTISCTLDLALLIDVSGSINDTELQQEKDAAATIVNNIGVSAVDANVAVFRFSTDGRMDLPFSFNTTNILNAIQNVARMGGGTNLAGAVTLARQQFALSRVNAPDVILVITDGAANRCADSTGTSVGNNLDCSPPFAAGMDPIEQASNELNAAKSEGAFVYMIGVGIPNTTLGVDYDPYDGMKLESWMRDVAVSPGGFASVADFTELQNEVANYNCQFFGAAPRPIDISPF